MRQDAFAVVLAGGRGERFWPMSTSRRPKQFLSLAGDKPLLSSAVDRLSGVIPRENIFVITSSDLTEAARGVLQSFPAGNVIGEPVGRDTAAAVTLGAALIKARDPDAVFCVLTADHVIGDVEIFAGTLQEAFRMASSNVLITIGMKPLFPSTGFGYIETGARIKPVSGKGEASKPVEFFEVIRFVEKPDRATASGYLKAGSFYWNSGMFIWSIKSYERALAAHCLPMKAMLETLAPVAGSARLDEKLASIYPDLQKISIDYALMEKADNIIMAMGEFAWDDVGSWTALENHLGQDAAGNKIAGKVESLDSTGNIIFSEQGLTVLCGVRNLVVVRTGNATLVCPKERAQEVKRMVQLLKEKKQYEEFI